MSQTKPKIVLVNAWHDDNKGDSAICECTLNLIKQRWPEAKLGLVSLISASSAPFKTAYRHLVKHFPDLVVTPSPFVFYDPLNSTNPYQGAVTQLPLAILRLLPPFSKTHPALQLISEADLVVVNGGHYVFTGSKSFRSTGRLLRILYPVLAAQSYKIPYVFFGQSLGPFNDPIGDRLAKYVLSGARAVWVREEISRQNLLQMGISESLLAVIPDAGFAMKPLMTEEVKNVLSKHDLSPGKFWAVTVRQSPRGSEDSRKKNTKVFLDEMAVLLNRVLEAGMTEKVALVAHTLGPTEIEDDRIATRELAQRLNTERVTVIEEDLSPRELSAFYGEASFLIGTRFHSVIFAMVADTPAYAISYSGPKTWGIMDMLGMKELCSELETFSGEKTFESIKVLDLASQAAKVSDRVSKLQEELEKVIEKLEITI